LVKVVGIIKKKWHLNFWVDIFQSGGLIYPSAIKKTADND